MTKPSQVWFGLGRSGAGSPSVFLKTLLYTTGKNGIVLEGMYVKLIRGETNQSFNIWTIGQAANMYRPGGIRVTNSGYLADHVFLLPKDGSDFRFVSGKYRIETYARIAGSASPTLLSEIELEVPQSLSDKIAGARGIYFDLNSDADNYVRSIDEIPLDQEGELLSTMKELVATAQKAESKEESSE